MIGGIGRWIRSCAPASKGAWWLLALEISIASVAVWVHFRSLADMPPGLYKDEISFAYNAHLVATTGRDEYGDWLPMYPKAFGEYKSAGYFYLCVLVMRLFGLSSWTVRLPSVLCWLIGSAIMYGFGRRLWPSAEARLFLLLQLAFTPSLLCFSRIAFEVILLYPALALFLLGVQRGFERRSPRWAAIAGVAIGASTYIYAPFRLLAPLHCILVLACYCSRRHLRSLVSFGASAFITVIPFAWYMYAHLDHLTNRYRIVGYVHHAISLTDKLQMFVTRYLNHFRLQYLLIRGDEITRIHTGYCGELFAPSVLSFLLGIALFVCVPRFRRVRFHRFLLGGLALSPIAAALTLAPVHSMQAFSLIMFAIPLSLYGFEHVLHRASHYLAALVIVTTVVCAAAFVKDYFGPYRSAAIAAFEYYGIEQAIEKAARAHATRIVIDSRRPSRHADLYAGFYTVTLAKRWHGKLPPLQPGRPRDVHPGEYFIFEDPKHAYTDLRDELPAESLYVAAPYGPITKRLSKHKKH
jgi:4-amino-4-deoxy-L-arabinose transferase-like glycosyltransferase